MKKFLAVFFSILITLTCMCQVVLAEEPSLIANEDCYSANFETNSIQPRALVELYEYQGYVRLQLYNNFSMSSKANLRLIIVADSPCTMFVYKKNILFGDVLIKEISVPGDSDSHTYLIQNDASAGNYSFKLTTDNYQCYSIFSFVSTEYA